eukprot:4749749-Prymnesium_polylepis.2
MMAVRRLAQIPSSHPFLFGVGLTGVKGATCDLVVQRYVERNEKIDTRRVVVFGTFSLLFTGVWQYALFVKVMPRLCPGAEAFALKPWREKLADRHGMRAVLQQCLM